MKIAGELSLTSPSPIQSVRPLAGSTSAAPGSFGDLVKTAVEKVDASQKTAEQEIAKVVTGESQDLHQTIAALQSADLTFQLALQVRNKLVNAYDEVMRMQV